MSLAGITIQRLSQPKTNSREPSTSRNSSGASTISTSCPSASSSSPPKSAARSSAPTTAAAWSASASPSPALKPGGKPYLHSHMLGVLPEYRNAGVGRLLKLHQREDALARGIDLIEWTFDPLETQKRLLQHRTPRRHHPPLRPQSVRHHHQPSARRPAHRPLRRRMVDRLNRARISPAGRSSVSEAHSHARRHRRNPRTRSRTRPRDPDEPSPTISKPPSRNGLAVIGFERSETWHLSPGTMGPPNEDRAHRPAPDPHAAGAFLRNQLRPHLRARHRPGRSHVAKASPAGAKSPPARILSITKSGPNPPG